LRGGNFVYNIKNECKKEKKDTMSVGDVITAILAYVIAGFVMWKLVWKKAFDERAKKQTSSSISYNEVTGTLTVYKRIKENKKAIKVAESRSIMVKYKPEEMVYTGVSGGGVSVGEWNKVGGYNYISGDVKTGKYKLCYFGSPIETIILDKNVLEESTNSPISRYLSIEDSSISIFDIDKYSKELVNASQYFGKLDTISTQNMLYSNHANCYSTKEKCEEIRNWICNL